MNYISKNRGQPCFVAQASKKIIDSFFVKYHEVPPATAEMSIRVHIYRRTISRLGFFLGHRSCKKDMF